MKNLLTPEDVQSILGYIEAPHTPTLRTLCYDYLTIWDELANERSISDRLLERIAKLEKLVSVEIKEGTVEMKTKVNGKCYALGIDLSICPTKEILTLELKCLTRSLIETLNRLNWFKAHQATNPSDSSPPAEET